MSPSGLGEQPDVFEVNIEDLARIIRDPVSISAEKIWKYVDEIWGGMPL